MSHDASEDNVVSDQSNLALSLLMGAGIKGYRLFLSQSLSAEQPRTSKAERKNTSNSSNGKLLLNVSKTPFLNHQMMTMCNCSNKAFTGLHFCISHPHYYFRLIGFHCPEIAADNLLSIPTDV